MLVFLGDRAYKLKKPVVFDFLDYSTRAAREEACHREVELNRRLAPDVYHGVADVIGPDGTLEDHLVVMSRLPDERRLARLSRGHAPELLERVDEVADLVAEFHDEAIRGPGVDAAASPEAVDALWDANTAGLLEAGARPARRRDRSPGPQSSGPATSPVVGSCSPDGWRRVRSATATATCRPRTCSAWPTGHGCSTASTSTTTSGTATSPTTWPSWPWTSSASAPPRPPPGS